MTSEPTQPSRREIHVPFLDQLRGIAITLVFLYHCLGISHGATQLRWNGIFPDFSASSSFLILRPIAFGWSGVSIFFVISGFCIHISHKLSKSTLKEFYTRRIFRIYPPYLLSLVAFSIATHTETFGNFVQFFSHLLLFHNLRPDTIYGINGSFWSIATEFQLYLLYPLLLFLARKTGWKNSLLITCALEGAIRIGPSIFYHFIDMQFPLLIKESPFGYWFSWSVGAACADSYIQGSKPFFRNFPVWLFPLLTILSSFVKPLSHFAFTFAALSTVCFLAHFLSFRSEVKHFQISGWLGKHLHCLGIASYSFYLWHEPLIKYAHKIVTNQFQISNWQAFLACCACGPLIIMLSNLLYKAIELPSIRIGKSISKSMFR